MPPASMASVLQHIRRVAGPHKKAPASADFPCLKGHQSGSLKRNLSCPATLVTRGRSPLSE
jgi:hypothetical protein